MVQTLRHHRTGVRAEVLRAPSTLRTSLGAAAVEASAVAPSAISSRPYSAAWVEWVAWVHPKQRAQGEAGREGVHQGQRNRKQNSRCRSKTCTEGQCGSSRFGLATRK